jgi:hypothetical protein
MTQTKHQPTKHGCPGKVMRPEQGSTTTLQQQQQQPGHEVS